MRRLLGFALGAALLSAPGCLFKAPLGAPIPAATVKLTIDGEAKAVVPMVIAKSRYFMEVRPAQGALRGVGGARQANLPADTYAFDLVFHPKKPDAGIPVGDGLPPEPGFTRETVEAGSLVITGPDPDTFFYERKYFGSAGTRRFPDDGLVYQVFTFYQTSSGFLNGVLEDTLQKAAGQPEIKIRIEFSGPFPEFTSG